MADCKSPDAPKLCCSWKRPDMSPEPISWSASMRHITSPSPVFSSVTVFSILSSTLRSSCSSVSLTERAGVVTFTTSSLAEEFSTIHLPLYRLWPSSSMTMVYVSASIFSKLILPSAPALALYLPPPSPSSETLHPANGVPPARTVRLAEVHSGFHTFMSSTYQ